MNLGLSMFHKENRPARRSVEVLCKYRLSQHHGPSTRFLYNSNCLFRGSSYTVVTDGIKK